MLFAGLGSVRMVKTCSFQILIAIADRIGIAKLMETWIEFRALSLRKVFFWRILNCLTTDVQRTTFVLIQSRPDRKNHLVCNNFCAAVFQLFVLLFLHFKSRGQISRVTCTVVARIPASGKPVPSTLTCPRYNVYSNFIRFPLNWNMFQGKYLLFEQYSEFTTSCLLGVVVVFRRSVAYRIFRHSVF